jgi:hypothetical protein
VGIFTRSLLLHSQAPLSYWSYAVLHATRLNNLVPHGLLGGSTPSEAWYQVKPDMRRLRVWGCTAHALLNRDERRRSGGKLGPVTKAYILVGINPLGPGWLLLDPVTRREVPSSGVFFQEHLSFFRTFAATPTPSLDWSHFLDPESIGVPAESGGVPVPQAPPPAGSEAGGPGTPVGDPDSGDSEDASHQDSPVQSPSGSPPAQAHSESGSQSSTGQQLHGPSVQQGQRSVLPMSSRAARGPPGVPGVVLGLPHNGTPALTHGPRLPPARVQVP